MEEEKKEKDTKEKQSKTEKRDVSEIFEVKKDGKKEVKQVSGDEEVKVQSKNQIQKENIILRNIFIGVGAIILLIVIGWYVVDSARHFEYEDMNFNVVKEGQIIFYNTAFPVIQNGKHLADYNFYIRNDPRKLDKDILFEGELKITPNMVINTTSELHCGGKGVIAVANLVKLYEFVGTKVIKDPNATCDANGNYMYVNILEGEQTKIEQTGPACYNIYVSDCEILEGTERFMTETFIKINEALKD